MSVIRATTAAKRPSTLRGFVIAAAAVAFFVIEGHGSEESGESLSGSPDMAFPNGTLLEGCDGNLSESLPVAEELDAVSDCVADVKGLYGPL